MSLQHDGGSNDSLELSNDSLDSLSGDTGMTSGNGTTQSQNRAQTKPSKSVQQATKINTLKNSGYQSCVLQYKPEPRPIQLVEVPEEEADITDAGKGPSPPAAQPQPAQPSPPSGEDDPKKRDFIPNHSYQEEIVPAGVLGVPEDDPVPFRDVQEFEEVPFQLPSPEKPVVPPSSVAVSSSLTKDLVADTSGVQWHRRISVTRFDRRNAPKEVSLILVSALSSVGNTKPASRPASGRRKRYLRVVVVKLVLSSPPHLLISRTIVLDP